jgi:hypothetical protein
MFFIVLLTQWQTCQVGSTFKVTLCSKWKKATQMKNQLILAFQQILIV